MTRQGSLVPKAQTSLELFQKILCDEFIRELQYYLDVSAGRSTLRADFTDKLLALSQDHLVTLISDLPIPGTSLLQGSVSYAIDWANDKRKDDKLSHAQQLGFDSEPEKLRIILENVAMEAACRYQYWITMRLVEEPLDGVIPFAKAAVERMLEYVLRNKLPLTYENLLNGLIEGRSGAYVSGYRNTQLSVKDEPKTGITAKIKRFLTIGNHTAEGAFGRTGLETYDSELWILKDKSKAAHRYFREQHQSPQSQQQSQEVSHQFLEHWFDYGYTKLVDNSNPRLGPKYSHIRVSRMLWQFLYGHLDKTEIHQPRNELIPTLQQQLNQFKPTWLIITLKELEEFVKKVHQDGDISLLDYCRALKPNYSDVELVFYRADEHPDEWDLSHLNFEGADLSYAVFNHCHFGGSLKGVRCRHSFFREADFTKVTSAEGCDFSEANLEFLNAAKVNFSNSDFTQAKLHYAELEEANLRGVKTLGAEWAHANLTNLQSNDLQEINRVQSQQCEWSIKQSEALHQLRQAQDSQQEQISALRHDLLQLEAKRQRQSIDEDATEAEQPTELDKLEQLTVTLMQEQQARLTLARHCQLETMRLEQQAALMQQVDREHAAQIKTLQQSHADMQVAIKQLTDFMCETHFLAERVERNEIKQDALIQHLASLEERFEHRLEEAEQRLDSLETRVDSVTRLVRHETVPELLKQLKEQAENLFRTMELERLQYFYLPLRAERSRKHTEMGADLSSVVNQFLFSEQQVHERVCLLLGDAGSGKSSFCVMLQQRLWREFEASPTGQNTRIPLRIEMKRFTREAAKNCINDVLKKDYNFTDDAIRNLKTSTNRFLFIFDGIDELSGGGIVNLYQENQLGQWGRDPKVMISCRHEYLADQPYHELLGPGGELNNAQICEWHLLSLSFGQIEDYLQRRNDKQELEGGSLHDYEDCLKHTPGLVELISTPFLLKIYVKAYPHLERSSTTIAKVQLYDAFMQAWFLKEEQSLYDRVAGISGDIKKAFINFSRRLAFAIYEERQYEVRYEVQPENPWEDNEEEAKLQQTPDVQRRDSKKWEKFFTNKDEKTVQTRRGCPLRCVDNKTYGFVHQSFLEYFVADSLWDSLLHSHTDSLHQWGERCLTKEPKMPAVIQFLGDRLRTSPERNTAITKLYQFIEASKYERTAGFDTVQKNQVVQAASNAMTVLNFGLVALSIKAHDDPTFFQFIQVPYADLSTAELAGVNFTGSDLSYSKFAGAKLSYAILDECTLTGIDVKQYPMLQEENSIKSVVYARDGQWMAVASGNVVHLYQKSQMHWDSVSVFQGHTREVTGLAFSPDSTQIASSSLDNTVRLWAMDGTSSAVLKGHKESVICVAYSPNGQILASGSKDKTIKLWSKEDDQNFTCSTLKGHGRKVTSLAFSLNGDELVSGSKDKTVRLWEISSGKNRVLARTKHWINSVAFSPDSRLIAFGGLDNMIQLWGRNDGLITECEGHSAAVNGIVFFPDGQQLASASNDRTIRIWAIDGTLISVLEGHDAEVTTLAVSPRGNHLISGSFDAKLRLWEVESLVVQHDASLLLGALSPPVAGHTQAVSAVVVSSLSDDEQHVASAGYDSTVRLWQLDGSAVRVIKGHQRAIMSLTYSSNTKELISASYDRTIRFWALDGKAGRVIPLSQHDEVTNIAVSPKQNEVACCVAEAVELWPESDALFPKVLSLNEEAPSQGAYSRELYTRSIKKPFQQASRRYELSSPSRFSKPIGERFNKRVNCVTFTSDGEIMALGCSDKTVRLYQSDCELIRVFLGHEDEVSHVAFTFDNQGVISGSHDHTVRLWDIQSGSPLVFKGHTDIVTSVACSFNKQLIASGSHDKTIRLWQRDGSSVAMLMGHKDAVMSVAFVTGSYQLVSGGLDKTVRLWQCDHLGRWVSMWQHPRDTALVLSGCSIRRATELSPLNQKLFEQLGGEAESIKPSRQNSPQKMFTLDRLMNRKKTTEPEVIELEDITASSDTDAGSVVSPNQHMFFSSISMRQRDPSPQDNIVGIKSSEVVGTLRQPDDTAQRQRCCVLL